MIDIPGERQTVPIGSVGADETARRLLAIVRRYMGEAEVEQVAAALKLAQEKCGDVREHGQASLQYLRLISPLEHALAAEIV